MASACTGCSTLHLLRALERHSHLAGRGPNSSSLFPPLAAVVAVAAEVVAYYLCKWLDSLMCKGSKH